jgi:hypothetical protein
MEKHVSRYYYNIYSGQMHSVDQFSDLLNNIRVQTSLGQSQRQLIRGFHLHLRDLHVSKKGEK